MKEQKNKTRDTMKDDQTKKSGKQGVDKAPGEDSPRGKKDETGTSQKAKKVNADPSKKKERPN